MTRRQVNRLTAKPFRPTASDVRRWTQVINCILFHGELPPYRKIKVRRLHAKYALVQCHEGRQKNYCNIEIHNRFDTFGCFFSILAHELIHVADFMHYGDTKRPDHGRFFFSHRELMKNIGLRLGCGY